MSIKRQIPNFFTLGNLLCGCLAIVFLFQMPSSPWKFWLIGILMFSAMIFDFLDGFVARILKVSSPMGLQLDSLSDMVTFGVLPGMLVYYILSTHPVLWTIAPPADIYVGGELLPNEVPLLATEGWHTTILPWHLVLLPYIGLLIPLFSAYRLAKFNVDTREGGVFYGLPTPANAFFFLSIFLIFGLDGIENAGGGWTIYPPLSAMAHEATIQPPILGWLHHPYVLAGLTVVFSILLVSDFELLAFKFKTYKFKDNVFRYLLLGGSAVLLAVFLYRGIPLVIFWYFLLSVLAKVTEGKVVKS